MNTCFKQTTGEQKELANCPRDDERNRVVYASGRHQYPPQVLYYFVCYMLLFPKGWAQRSSWERDMTAWILRKFLVVDSV